MNEQSNDKNPPEDVSSEAGEVTSPEPSIKEARRIKFEKKIYTTRQEKTRDFLIGVGLFIVLNAVLALIGYLAIILTQSITSSVGPIEVTSDNLAWLAMLIVTLCVYCLPPIANLAALVYFLLTRQWIALGMLAVFGFLLLLGMVLGIVAAIACLVSLAAGS